MGSFIPKNRKCVSYVYMTPIWGMADREGSRCFGGGFTALLAAVWVFVFRASYVKLDGRKQSYIFVLALQYANLFDECDASSTSIPLFVPTSSWDAVGTQ